MAYDPDTGIKRLPVRVLYDILSNIQPNFRVEINAVGNLLVTDFGGRYRGYIDFNTGRFESVDDTEF